MVNITDLKEKRMNLLMALGEEAHGVIRKKENSMSEKMKKISQEIKQLDIQISSQTNPIDATTCPKCQTKLEVEAMFCKQCGFAVKDYYAAYVNKCTCCNAPMKAEQKFCINCGTKSNEQIVLQKTAE